MAFYFKSIFEYPLSQKWWAVLVLVALVFIVYTNSIPNSFVSDDIPAILKNEDINKLSFAFNSPYSSIRPFLNFTIFKVFGLTPVFFRIINIFFHLGATLVAYFLIRKTINSYVAFFTASLFAVHPLLTESVTWISGGPYPQYSFFIILSFFFYILSLENKKFYIPSLISFAAGLLSSEKAIILPLIIFLYLACFQNIKKDWQKIIPFLIICFAWLFFFLKIGGGLEERLKNLEEDYYRQEIRPYNPLFQIPIAVTSYLELIFWPKNLSFYHTEMLFSLKEYVLRLTAFIIFSGMILCALFYHRKLFFWLSFFIISLLPTLLPFGASWVVAERYVYLGALGIFVIISIALEKIANIKKLKLPVYFVFILILITLGARTIVRNTDWRDEDSLWIATAKTAPSSYVNHNNLGDMYYRHGNTEKSIEEFKKAIQLNPKYAEAYHNLANTYLKIKKTDEAIENYQKAVSIAPNLWQSYQNMGSIYFDLEKYDLAEENLIKAIKINSKDFKLYANLGAVYLKLNKKEKAKEEFKKALLLEPENKEIKKILSNLNE